MKSIFTKQIQDLTPYLYIGKISELTGASRKAIRLYEERGLIPKPARKGNYRIYSDQDAFLIHMIKTAQSVGFSLAEIKGLVEHKVKDRTFPLKKAEELCNKKRVSLRNEIEAIHALEKRLDKLQEMMNQTFG